MKFLRDDILQDTIINALELGSTYWCYIPDEEIDKVRKSQGSDGRTSLSEKIVQAVMYGGVVLDVYDIEEPDEMIGQLDYSKFSDRMEKCYQDFMWAIDAEADEQGDAETSDIILQHLILGEVVYG
jgi:hypothetical protein